MHELKILLMLLLYYHADAVEFAAKPKDVNEFEGQTATLKCFLKHFNIETHVVSWWKEKAKLSQQNEVVAMDLRMSVNLDELPFAGAYSYSLLITELIIEDEGDYYCQIDQAPTISSGRARLFVLQIPSSEYPKCSKSANMYLVGSQVKLTCISELISPPVKLNWIRKGSSTLSMNFQAETRDDFFKKHYTFIAKKTDNDATFLCQQTTDAVSEMHNCTISNLNIQYRPEVKIQHTSALFAGSDSILFCQSFANPPVTQFQWTFIPVLNANEYIADGQVLTLIKPSIATNGTRITCSAENNIGINTNTVTLHIKKEERRKNFIHKKDEDLENSPKTKRKNMNMDAKETQSVSLYVVIIIIVLVVIIIVVVVIIPVYYYCFCKTRTVTDSSGREIYQPTVYYDTRNRASNSGVYDRCLPRLPSTGQYDQWRHSFASQVPEDLDQQGYMYIEERNE
ncbi:cell adhesion molecule 4-like [Anneissia japonica]|uniref:cell adhesion molecule 4-like n=1 Tax=Anneissia japonica TaxID=1529436 RepID=UPI0014259FDC|nr:cell adhesion molecule 4-like [Anneissia japonica]